MDPFLPAPVSAPALAHLDAILCRHRSARWRAWALVLALAASAVVALLG
jgi:hypothetical protein